MTATAHPRYPTVPLPPGFDCWAYNRTTGEVFPAYEHQGVPGVDFKDRFAYGDPNDWEILYDPLVEEVAFVTVILTGLLELLANWTGYL